MTMVKLMGDLAGLPGDAVEAAAGVTVEAVAQVLREHGVMRLHAAGPRVVVGAGAGARAILETAMLAVAGAVALLVVVGMRQLLLSLGLLGLTQGTKALQGPSLGMTTM